MVPGKLILYTDSKDSTSAILLEFKELLNKLGIKSIHSLLFGLAKLLSTDWSG